MISNIRGMLAARPGYYLNNNMPYANKADVSKYLISVDKSSSDQITKRLTNGSSGLAPQFLESNYSETLG